MFKKIGCILLLLMAVTACESTFIKTGGVTLEPKTEDCEVRVLTVVPSAEFVEVGIIKFAIPKTTYSLNNISDQDRALVCANGGNAILFANPKEEGEYKTATVLLVND